MRGFFVQICVPNKKDALFNDNIMHFNVIYNNIPYFDNKNLETDLRKITFALYL